jgi:hypothetical protein
MADFRFRLRERFLYAYDFRDNWQYDIRVEHIVAADPKRTYPVCIGGKRAAPPEECGGTEVYLARWRHWKYDLLCRRLQDGVEETEGDFFTDDEDEAIHEPGYDPDLFNRCQVNAQLRRWAA